MTRSWYNQNRMPILLHKANSISSIKCGNSTENSIKTCNAESFDWVEIQLNKISSDEMQAGMFIRLLAIGGLGI